MKTNIGFSKEYWQLIMKAAEHNGQTEEDFIVESAVQAAKDSQCNLNLKEEVYSFIKEQIPSKRNHTKLVFVKFTKFLILLFIDSFCIVTLFWLTKKIPQNYSDLKDPVRVVLVSLIIFSPHLISVFFMIINSYNNIGKKKIKKEYVRIETKKNISLTHSFARKLSKKYSLTDLKLAEEDLKEVIDGKENTKKAYSAGTIFFSILLLWLIREIFEISKQLEDSFSYTVGSVSFVIFITALLRFISNLNYFNDLVFYKKGVSALRQAQINIEKWNSNL